MKWEWFEDTPPTYQGNSTLPFITMDSEFLAFALDSSSEKTRIVFIDETGDSYPYCDSITSLLESTIECFASRAVIISDEGYIREDRQLSSEIWRDKNPDTLVQAMTALNTSLSICTSGNLPQGKEYSMTIDSLISALRTLRMLRSPEATTLIQDCLIKLEKHRLRQTEGLKFSLRNWLRDIEDTKVVCRSFRV